MKLLGLRLCEHDSNISYFDGTKLHYYKSERDYQIKHHGYNDLITWRDDIQKIFPNLAMFSSSEVIPRDLAYLSTSTIPFLFFNSG